MNDRSSPGCECPHRFYNPRSPVFTAGVDLLRPRAGHVHLQLLLARRRRPGTRASASAQLAAPAGFAGTWTPAADGDRLRGQGRDARRPAPICRGGRSDRFRQPDPASPESDRPQPAIQTSERVIQVRRNSNTGRSGCGSKADRRSGNLCYWPHRKAVVTGRAPRC